MTQNVKPTRSELMILKKKIKLAKSGHNLLKKKRDGLILDFFEILKSAKSIRKEMTEDYKQALEKINIARALEGDLSLKSLAMASLDKPEIKLEAKNIMGVVVPKINVIEKEVSAGKALTISSITEEAIDQYKEVIKKIIQAAETEVALKKLLKEIEKTKRRVNALEFSVIPKMDETKKFISLRLEEMEREGIFRMKRIKA